MCYDCHSVHVSGSRSEIALSLQQPGNARRDVECFSMIEADREGGSGGAQKSCSAALRRRLEHGIG